MDYGKDLGFYFKYDGRLLEHVEKRKEIRDKVCVENSLCGYLDCKRSGEAGRLIVTVQARSNGGLDEMMVVKVYRSHRSQNFKKR